jgi:hypothetical protein
MNRRHSPPGCFGYGCLIAVVLFSVVIGGIALWGHRSIKSAVRHYTSESAPLLPVSLVSDEVMTAATDKVNRLKAAAARGEHFSVTFTGDELRGIIASTPFKGRVDVSLVAEEAAVQFSVPLSQVGNWEAASYLVSDIASRAIRGSARGVVGVTDGKLSLRLSGLTLNDVELGEMARGHAAEWIVGAISSVVQDEAGDQQNSSASALEKVRSLRIAGGNLYLELQ